MTDIYRNSSFARRMTISTLVVVGAVAFGFWELSAALRAGSEGGGHGFLFAALFIVGGLYGLRQLRTDFADNVVLLRAQDSDGTARITIWRPFASKRIDGSIHQFRNWRYEMQTSRPNTRVPMILADHPGHATPLRFELGKGIEIGVQLRALAPDVFAAADRGREATPAA